MRGTLLPWGPDRHPVRSKAGDFSPTRILLRGAMMANRACWWWLSCYRSGQGSGATNQALMAGGAELCLEWHQGKGEVWAGE